MILVLMQVAATFTVQTKILAIATIVFALVQAIKKAFPAISGWYALAINVVLSIGGVLATTSAQDLFSVTTLIALITSVSASAGIHGTWSNLLKGGN